MATENQLDERFVNALSDAIEHAGNEFLVLARVDEFLSPRPARLATTEKEQKDIQRIIDKAVAAYGGPPSLIITGIDDPKQIYDTYLSDAIAEAIQMFNRARNSLCRAHTFMIAADLIKTKPTLTSPTNDSKIDNILRAAPTNIFWEHAETCFIRLVGYWDRIGQILDYAFFSIRQYERDGFSTVLDRIRANTLPMFPEFQNSANWDLLWGFRASAQIDGLQWLLSRRNLLVHSVHLRPAEAIESDKLYESAFNHLDAKIRKRLAVGTEMEEITRLHQHLAKAAELFSIALQFCIAFSQYSQANAHTRQ